jgi:hypothetical protein
MSNAAESPKMVRGKFLAGEHWSRYVSREYDPGMLRELAE